MEHTLAKQIRCMALAMVSNLLLVAAGFAASSADQHVPQAHEPAAREPAAQDPIRPHPALAGQGQPLMDRSGRPRIGVASFYARFFAGRKMADGVRMDPRGRNAASR